MTEQADPPPGHRVGSPLGSHSHGEGEEMCPDDKEECSENFS